MLGLMQSTTSWISLHYVCIKGQRQGSPISIKGWGDYPSRGNEKVCWGISSRKLIGIYQKSIYLIILLFLFISRTTLAPSISWYLIDFCYILLNWSVVMLLLNIYFKVNIIWQIFRVSFKFDSIVIWKVYVFKRTVYFLVM